VVDVFTKIGIVHNNIFTISHRHQNNLITQSQNKFLVALAPVGSMSHRP
jgi:hypothetical protein